ncbi:hypothetical protein STAFG_2004 [Streptomyces afghaniensis 772]|uniref:Uncharacterized protein n=1 Tax=Streptomyces afghaniensis 772 TaxID=1283301 RepID=S4MVL8_9ACTN|nr:hypothetical protein STAFG_2004 [Streptomyces afghaniensis 772]
MAHCTEQLTRLVTSGRTGCLFIPASAWMEPYGRGFRTMAGRAAPH